MLRAREDRPIPTCPRCGATHAFRWVDLELDPDTGVMEQTDHPPCDPEHVLARRCYEGVYISGRSHAPDVPGVIETREFSFTTLPKVKT
jgi:hypothetical protein